MSYDLMSFSKFTEFCNHHQTPILKHFHASEKPLVPIPAPGNHDSAFCLCSNFFFLNISYEWHVTVGETIVLHLASFI